ncbi:hypothetical protein Fleli_0333 [Bernardetia litoralis DSM 6794]|uniref:Uncharacterized protein n=1 Tax=Bernardetia litoralis (strain ATCC 23117 / DSM 6794 / NBRC 15988 / NCIMB 1366 / Fx l1 / Sio-4) TaxID=880071 RepID=I4AFT2_BERLS|nr:hypothetical protein [Bernardetia litoralis]AFM02817.1 hypothetical protein Fleli_0333 [Bernardetia litoralis DSM 6794]
MQYLDKIILNNSYIWGVSVIIAIIGFFRLAFLIINKDFDLKKIIICIVFFIQLFVFGELFIQRKTSFVENTRKEIRLMIGNDDIEVSVNNLSMDEHTSMILIEYFKTLKNLKRHHSSPRTMGIIIKISSLGKNMELELRQDNENVYEYWVFLNKGESSEKSIGQIIVEDSSLYKLLNLPPQP